VTPRKPKGYPKIFTSPSLEGKTIESAYGTMTYSSEKRKPFPHSRTRRQEVRLLKKRKETGKFVRGNGIKKRHLKGGGKELPAHRKIGKKKHQASVRVGETKEHF